jgi:hypothetical protein
MKTLSAFIMLCAAITSPVFAQDGGPWGPGSRMGLELQPWSYRYRSCFQGPGFGPCPGRLYSWSIGRDRSRVGGIAPSLRPSGS